MSYFFFLSKYGIQIHRLESLTTETFTRHYLQQRQPAYNYAIHVQDSGKPVYDFAMSWSYFLFLPRSMHSDNFYIISDFEVKVTSSKQFNDEPRQDLRGGRHPGPGDWSVRYCPQQDPLLPGHSHCQESISGLQVKLFLLPRMIKYLIIQIISYLCLPSLSISNPWF